MWHEYHQYIGQMPNLLDALESKLPLKIQQNIVQVPSALIRQIIVIQRAQVNVLRLLEQTHDLHLVCFNDRLVVVVSGHRANPEVNVQNSPHLEVVYTGAPDGFPIVRRLRIIERCLAPLE